MTLTTSPSLRMTSGSEGRGETWETTLLTEMEVGNAIPADQFCSTSSCFNRRTLLDLDTVLGLVP